MRVRRGLAVAGVTIGLSVVMVSPAGAATDSAPAAHTSAPAATAQCPDLLACVLGVVPELTSPSGLPAVINVVPGVLNAVLPPPATPTPTPPAPKPTPPPRVTPPPVRHAPTPAPKPTPHVTAVVRPTPAPRATVAPVAPVTATPTPPAPKPRDPVAQVVHEVAQAVADTVSYFGWNLLVLIPVALVAYAMRGRIYTRRMAR